LGCAAGEMGYTRLTGGMSGRFGDFDRCLMSNAEKRPLVFFHHVNRFVVNILSFNLNRFGPDYCCNLLVDFGRWRLLILLCVGAFEVAAMVPHLYRGNSHQCHLCCMFGWFCVMPCGTLFHECTALCLPYEH
jgi:hypothetical protein